MSIDTIINWFAGIGPGRVALFAASFALVGLITPALIEPYRLDVVHDTIRSENLPVEFDGTRVVFLADVHAGPYFSEARMRDLVERVNDLDADVLVLGGDYVGGRAHGERIFYPAVGDMKATMGRFAVLGNHDNWENPEAARDGLKAAGFTLLGNNSVEIDYAGESIRIAGLEDLDTGNPNIEVASRDIDPGQFAMLVTHNPEALETGLPLAPGVFGFAMAGHTHGGQINVLNSLAPIANRGLKGRHVTGWRNHDGTPVLVTNGVGTVTMPARSGAEPQIHVITLRTL